jgi:hypothetical protein
MPRRTVHRLLVAVGATAASLGCADRPTQPALPEATVDAVAGDAQASSAGEELRLPLVVRARDDAGAPRAGVPVRWKTFDGGYLATTTSVTDDSGYARAWWTLGTRVGAHRAQASVGRGQAASFLAEGDAPPAPGVVHPIPLVTFDSSGETVHPDIVRVPRGWGNGRRFLAVTPYPGGDGTKELPSVFASGGDPYRYAIPEGGNNPVARTFDGYLSDPDMLFNPSARQLWLYYRAVTNENVIYLLRSSDGSTWTAPWPVVRAPNHHLISPSIVRVSEREWHMWTIDGGVDGCASSGTTVEHRTSVDGIRWSDPETQRIGLPGLPPWHIDVTWIAERREYWAVFNVKPGPTCATPAVYLATSPDGREWTTRPSPILERGAIPQFRDVVYRSTLDYDADADLVTLWFSGARYTGRWQWSTAVQRMPVEDFLDIATHVAMPRRFPPTDAPPLLKAP